jgi:hypothetical protein
MASESATIRKEAKMVRAYIDLLKRALANIESDYFSVRAACPQLQIVIRERVFCYELYHQMRLLMTEDSQLLLRRVHAEELKEAAQKPSADRIYLLTIESPHAECEEHLLSSLPAVSSLGVAGGN